MQNLSTHIAYLLVYHDCVILPGIGAFVVYDAKADVTWGEGYFSPPERSIGFNPGLKHNDGLLSGLVMRTQGISYEQAAIIVTRFCEDMKDKILKEKEYSIPFVGIFRLSAQGRILFTPKRESVANANYYGFDEVHVPALNHRIISSSHSAGQAQEVVRSLRERSFQAVRVIAASAAIFMFCATPIGHQVNVQEAGLFTSTAKIYSYVPDLSISSVPLDIYQPPVVEMPIELPPVEEITIAKHLPDKYYIIVGSFHSRAAAKAQLPAISSRSRYTPSILDKDGKYRVYIRSFQNKPSAERFLNSFRAAHPRYSDAWIYSDRH